MRALILGLLLLGACGDRDKVGPQADADEDGWVALDDCDDTDPFVHPGADETCDGVDQDCDGEVDEEAVDASTWYADADEDGWGDASSTQAACEAPAGWVSDDTDCDDADASVHPGAEERCDGHDDDCDGEVDEPSAVDAIDWFVDADGDGWGLDGSEERACERPGPRVDRGGDCDDTEPLVNPGADEVCDGRTDEDCDGFVDEGDAVDATTWYTDADADHWGAPESAQQACEDPGGAIRTGGDCDDTDASVNPDATEVCDGSDNDCDGTTDEPDAADARTWYADDDGDGYGTPDTTTRACKQGSGWSALDTDCDDTDAAISPDATEVCDDGIDDDCDGTADDGCPVEHCGTISADETWSAADTHIVTCDVYVEGSSSPTLTVQGGAQVYFDPGTGLFVGYRSDGALEVTGRAATATFTSSAATPTAGDWDGIVLYRNDVGSDLYGLSVEYADYAGYGAIYVYGASPTLTEVSISDSGSSGVYLSSGTLTMSSSTVVDCADDGVYLSSTAELAKASRPTFHHNTITGCGGYPVILPADFAGQIDSSTSLSGNGTDLAQLTRDYVTTDATWELLDVPWLIAGDVEVRDASGEPELTLADGVELYFDTGVALKVGYGAEGTLLAEGTTTGITLTSAASSPAEGDWDGITIGDDDGGSSLAGVTVEYAGDNGYGGIYLYRASASLDDCTVANNSNHGIYVGYGGTLSLTDSAVASNESNGVYLSSSAALADFDSNTLRSNGEYPISLPADSLGLLDSGSSYSGNGTDLVQVWSDYVESDATWSLLDADYLVDGDVHIGGSAAPVVEIEDGVVMYFESSAGLTVGYSSSGTLSAVGSSSAGITFTSAQTSPTHGDWDGITFGRYCDASATVVSNAQIVYGGGNGYANAYFNNCDATLASSALAYSSKYGVYRYSSTPTLRSLTYIDNLSGTVY